MKKKEKGFDAIDVILNVTNFFKWKVIWKMIRKMKKVKINMNEIKEIILKFWVNLSIKKELNINQIFDFMFKNKIMGVLENLKKKTSILV